MRPGNSNRNGRTVLHEAFHIYFPHIDDWEAPALASAIRFALKQVCLKLWRVDLRRARRADVLRRWLRQTYVMRSVLRCVRLL
jgi:hypothetical protein